MRVLKTLLKCVIIIDGDLFIGCIIGAIIAIVALSIIKPDKFN